MRHHRVLVDEPEDVGGSDKGPTPTELLAAALVSCTAITMEMYAKRKGWSIDGVKVTCDYEPAERGCPTKFMVDIDLPDHLDAEQVERLRVIAAKCPVHRVLEGEVVFDERIV